MEFVIAGAAAASAGAICNPLEVVKVRMQLQGELSAKGLGVKNYRNIFHAFYTIATKEGIFALQKGLGPFVCYQFVVSGAGRGLYQNRVNRGWNLNSRGEISAGRTLLLSVSCGAFGAVCCSPFYLIKTHLQSQANEVSNAVGYQHSHKGMMNALLTIYRNYGIRGLWRGTSSQIPRVSAAGAGQICSFTLIHEFMKNQFPGEVWLALGCASFTAGLFTSTVLAPFDLVATRFFNQGTDAKGKGILYKNVVDCVVKVYRSEGLGAFFKGWTAIYFRFGPYTMLLFMFWERLKHHHAEWKENQLNFHN